MGGEIPEPVLKSMLATEKFMGKVEERLKQGDQTMQEIKEQQKLLATKEEVFAKVDAGIEEHVQAYHPSEAEVVGEEVLRRRKAIKEWIAGHPKSSGILTILGLVLSYFGLELKGLI